MGWSCWIHDSTQGREGEVWKLIGKYWRFTIFWLYSLFHLIIPHRVQTLEQRPVTMGTTTTSSTPSTAEPHITTPLNLPTTRADLTGRVMRPPNTNLPSRLMMQGGLRTPRAQEVITVVGMEGVILMITILSILDITVSWLWIMMSIVSPLLILDTPHSHLERLTIH